MSEQEQQPAAMTVGEVLAEIRDRRGITHPKYRVLEVATLERWAATLAQVEGVLAALVVDGWMGWYHDDDDKWHCNWCQATGEWDGYEDDMPAHEGGCPVLVARRLLAGGQ